MVRSSLTAALGLPTDAVPSSTITASRPTPPTFNATHPLQPAGAPPQRPLPVVAPQVAIAPSLPTPGTAQIPVGGGGLGRVSGHHSSGVSSLTALIGQPLPPSQAAAQSGSTALPSQAAAAAPAQSNSSPAADVATVSAPSSGAVNSAAGSMSQALPSPLPTLSVQSLNQPVTSQLSGTAHVAPPYHANLAPPPAASPSMAAATPVAVIGGTPQVTPAAVFQALAAAAVAVQQQQQSTAAAESMHNFGAVSQQLQPSPSAMLAQGGALPGRNAFAQQTTGATMPSAASQQSASIAQIARAAAPAARAVAPGAPGQGRAGDRKALVGEDVWQLASDVMAAGGTATTAAAVTTAAQQVAPHAKHLTVLHLT